MLQQLPFSGKQWLFALFFLFGNILSAQLIIVADEEQAIYEAGEAMNFMVTSTQSGLASYVIRHDRYTPIIASGTVELNANQPTAIPFTLNESGMVLCWVSQNGFKATGAAAFSPYDMAPYEDDPSDLLAFWDNLKDQLAGEEIEPILTFEEDGDYSTSYRINLKSIDDRRVYGYISVPDGEGPFPAVLKLPPYGSAANIASPDFATAERTGMLAMSISIHNTEPDEVDPNSYDPDIIDDEDMNYYRYAVIGAIRALDYLESRDDYDGENLAVMGVSQGGGLSLLVAGLDDRVKLLANSNPALCQHTGYKYDRAGGFPYYLRKSDNEIGTQTHFDATVDATKYFDAARLAKYFDGASLTLIGYRDTICPPATSYAAFNQLPGPKVLVQAREVGHNHPNEYQIGRYDLFRRYFPSTLSPPWPWPDNTTGYYIEASANNTTVTVNELLELNGLVELNGSTTGDWTFNWRQLEGPGITTFSNSSVANPEVSFNMPGTYRLEFRANDEAIDLPGKFYTAIDYLNIEVVCSSITTTINEDICEGESITIGNETYTETGMYDQTYTTNIGCDSIVMIDLQVNPLPSVSLGNNAVITTDSTLVFTLGQYESILWSDGSTGNNFQFDGATNGPGTFVIAVTVENEFNCFSATSVEIEVMESTGLWELENGSFTIDLSPNPVTSLLNINIENKGNTVYELQLVNCLGEVVLADRVQSERIQLDLGGFSRGLYFLVVEDVWSGERVSRKVVVSTPDK